LRRHAGAVRAVAGATGRHVLQQDAASIDGLSELDELRIARHSRRGLLRLEIRGELSHVVRGQGRRHARHNCIGPLRWLAVPRPEVGELFQRVVGVLASEHGIHGERAVAVRAMAGSACAGGGLLGLGQFCCGNTLG